jgi:DNA polymerase/3'-5' exonuclease PolX
MIYTGVHFEDIMTNRAIAEQLMKWAHALEDQHANLFRIKAYRRAAEAVLGLERPVEEIVSGEGRRVLRELPGIGPKMCVKIETLARIGDITNLNEDSHTMVKK